MNNYNNNFFPLTPAVFYILLALAVQDRHGYGIMKKVEEDSEGRVKMGPGTLYGSIERMLKDKLIEEAGEGKGNSGERRKYYRITSLGRKHLQAELERYERVVRLKEGLSLAVFRTLFF